MNQFAVRLCVALLACVMGSEARSQFFYTYEGQDFTDASGSYTTADRITGQFEVLEVLPPFLINEEIGGIVGGFTFSDGVQTRTSTDSTTCGFRVTTDGTGAIKAWSISLREEPLPSLGSPYSILDTLGSGQSSIDRGGIAEAGASACGTISSFQEAGSNFGRPGQWTTSAPLPLDPQTYQYTGEPFSTITAPNVSGDAISGAFTVNGAIPPRFGPGNIAPLIESFSFTDGQDTFDSTNGAICDFQISTDLYGRIASWEITVALDAQAMVVEDQQRLLTVSSSADDVAATGLAGAQPCDFSSFSVPTESRTSDNGSWGSPAYPDLALTRYAYTGQCYDSATGNGEIGDRTTGWIDFEGALPPDLDPGDVADYVVGFSFRDDLQARRSTDSILCSVEVGTDGSGEINAWSMLLRESPLPALGAPQGSMQLDSVALNFSSIVEAPNSICASASAIDFQSVALEGSWLLTDVLLQDEFQSRRCSQTLRRAPLQSSH